MSGEGSMLIGTRGAAIHMWLGGLLGECDAVVGYSSEAPFRCRDPAMLSNDELPS